MCVKRKLLLLQSVTRSTVDSLSIGCCRSEYMYPDRHIYVYTFICNIQPAN